MTCISAIGCHLFQLKLTLLKHRCSKTEWQECQKEFHSTSKSKQSDIKITSPLAFRMPERCTFKYNFLHLYGNQDSLQLNGLLHSALIY